MLNSGAQEAQRWTSERGAGMSRLCILGICIQLRDVLSTVVGAVSIDVGLGFMICVMGRVSASFALLVIWLTSAYLCSCVQVLADVGQVLVGRASVVDGDTIDIHGERVRFNGIDAPESSQLCLDGSGNKYRCGAASAIALADFLATSVPVTCSFVDRDRYGRFVGDCHLANGDGVQDWLVSSGYALDWPRYSGGKYAALQDEARAARRGIWKGEFQMPWEWRAEKRAGHIKNAASVPLASTAGASGGCVIKGNINSKGVHIFHVPGQRDYQKTKISEGKGERWFCSAKEAIAAGWRPAER
jgi:endonuclease YncB( thermonuclease family)